MKFITEENINVYWDDWNETKELDLLCQEKDINRLNRFPFKIIINQISQDLVIFEHDFVRIHPVSFYKYIKGVSVEYCLFNIKVEYWNGFSRKGFLFK